MSVRPAPSAVATHDGFAAPIRAFLAIRMAPAVHERVVRLKHQLAASGASVRWTRDESLHLTLKFLGELAADRLQSVRDSLAPVLAEVASFPARVTGLGVFPRPERPRVIWVGIEAPELMHLARLVERTTSTLGFTAEERPFRAHVTLGRVKDRSGWAPLANALEKYGENDFGTFEVRHVTAFRSDLQRGGSVYTEIWTIPLSIDIGGGDHGSRR